MTARPVTVRMPSELHKEIAARAKKGKKTISEVVLGLLAQALKPIEAQTDEQYQEHQDIHQHLDFVLERLVNLHGELLFKAVVAGREARYYARLAAMHTEAIGGPGAKLAEIDQGSVADAQEYIEKPPTW